MFTISNEDKREVERLLGVLTQTAGNTDKAKNIRRRATLLKRKLERKQPQK
jgi:uncharacterized protein (UPF0147 family)